MAKRKFFSPGASTVTKQTAPAPTGLHSTRQKFTLLIAFPPSLSSKRIAGFSPATRTFGAGGFGAAGSWARISRSSARARSPALPSAVRDKNVILYFPSKTEREMQIEILAGHKRPIHFAPEYRTQEGLIRYCS